MSIRRYRNNALIFLTPLEYKVAIYRKDECIHKGAPGAGKSTLLLPIFSGNFFIGKTGASKKVHLVLESLH